MIRLFSGVCACFLAFTSAVTAQSNVPEFSGGVTAIGQRANDERIASLITASADLFITLERETGSWLLYLEANPSPADDGVASQLIESNADAGSSLDQDRKGRAQISELNYTFQFTQSTLTAGLIDPSGYLDRTRITNDENVQFMGAGFVNNPTIEFPDYSVGIAFQRAAGNGLPEFNAVLSTGTPQAIMGSIFEPE